MKPVDLKTLESLVRPAVEGQGYELCDLEWRREQGGWVFRLYIDRRPGQGYVSHEDCANVSHEISALLDVHDVLPALYSLEVSSPGINRPLKRPEDFARFIGQQARVRLRLEAAALASNGTNYGGAEGAAPRRNFLGTLRSVREDVVRLALEDGGEVDLRVSDMEKANLAPELGVAKQAALLPKPGAKPGKGRPRKLEVNSERKPEGRPKTQEEHKDPA